MLDKFTQVMELTTYHTEEFEQLNTSDYLHISKILVPKWDSIRQSRVATSELMPTKLTMCTALVAKFAPQGRVGK